MKILIKNGRVIDPANNSDKTQDIYISAGKIAALGNTPENFSPNRTIDATGKIICPGLIDLAARLREPGHMYKATLESEMRAAVAGGITGVACPPDTQPVLDEPGLVEMLKYRAQQLHLGHVYPLGAITKQLAGKQLTEMNELIRAGCVGFSQADTPIADTQVLWNAMQYAATFGFTLFLRPEDPFLGRDGVAHNGEVANRLGLKGIPNAAESLAITRLMRIAKETNSHVHLCRISTAESVEMIRNAKTRGVPVTCDVSAYHLHLTEKDLGFFDANCHLQPPLRTQRDQQALAKGVAEGVIDAICSDHTPVDDDAKMRPFAETEAGASGLELLLPLTLKWAQNNNISLLQALHRITVAPAKILGIETPQISIGQAADLCVFDADEYWLVNRQNLVSQGKNTPFNGLEVAGKVHATLVNGHVVYQHPPA